MASSFIVATAALLSIAVAAPLQDGLLFGPLEARQNSRCDIGTQANSAAPYDSSCWDALNIMPYLTKWKATTPTCTDAQSSAGQTLNCCVASEPWSTCFLRLATRQLNVYDCTKLTTTACSFPAKLDPALDPTIVSQVNYVVLNIMMINNFFDGYYTGQLFFECSKQSSSIDYRSSSPKHRIEGGSKLEYFPLKQCFELIEPNERERKYTERSGGIDIGSGIPRGISSPRKF